MDVKTTSTVRRFLSLLCGEYSNRQQALDNPPFFAHIFLRYRPLEHLQSGSILLEQTYAVSPKTPYRLRVVRAEEHSPGVIKLWNHTFWDPQRFASATFDKMCRRKIQQSDLICLNQCHYQVTEKNDGYRGEIEPGCRCIVHNSGRDTVLVSTFSLKNDSLTTLDRGYDPNTNEHCWGSVAGEFRFQRTANWSSDIPMAWI
ncbi:chromophore lyase CpcT/CpeT [Synechococcus sp. M16CYN]|uniref:chromophore lyase CpcT/CpeT n=1 Tax=Synechococcus sp. M16CYN TaxID=3103139 RepID=UPI0032443A27